MTRHKPQSNIDIGRITWQTRRKLRLERKSVDARFDPEDFADQPNVLSPPVVKYITGKHGRRVQGVHLRLIRPSIGAEFTAASATELGLGGWRHWLEEIEA